MPLTKDWKNDPDPSTPLSAEAMEDLETRVQAEIDAHVNDTSAAHAASAVSFSPTGGIAASTVQAAIAEVDSEAVRDGDAAGGVLSGTFPNPGFASDMATQAELDAHTGDTTDAHDASAISFVPTGTIAATDVQAAIAEVASEAGGGSGGSTIVQAASPTGVAATDRAAINTALAALPAGGGVVQLQAGTYLTDQTISLGSNTTLRGMGKGATILKGPSSLVYLVRALGTIPAWADRVTLTATALKSPTAATGWLPKVSAPTTSRAGWLNTALAVGDYVLIGSDDPWPLTLQSTTRGEIARVRAIDSGTQFTLWSFLNDTYTTATNAFAWKIQFVNNVVIEGIRFENSTPNTNTNGLLWIDYGKGCEVRNCDFYNSDERGVRLSNCLDCHIRHCHFQDFTDQSNTAPILLGYGVSLFNACQQCSVRGCTGDRLRNLYTTNGTANPGVPRHNEISDCIMWNATNNAYSGHEEGEHNRYINLKAFGGAENATGASHGGGTGAGISIRHNYATIQNFECVGAVRFGVWTREDITDLILDGAIIKDTHWWSGGSSKALLIDGDRGRVRNVIIENCDDVAVVVAGDNNDIEVDVRNAGLAGGSTPTALGALQFTSDFGGSNNRVRLRARDCAAAIVADSGTVSNNLVQINGLTNCPIGDTKWVETQALIINATAASPRGTNVNIASPGATLDGVTLSTSNRILLKDQTTASQNGPWVWNGAAVALSRPTDLTAKLFDSIQVIVEQGTENDGTTWALVTPNPIVLGTTSLRFTQLSPDPSMPVSSKYPLGPFRPTNAILENMMGGRWAAAMTAQAALASGTVRVFPLGMLRAGQTASAINFYVAAAASGAPTNSWGGIATFSDRVIRAISATSTANPGANSVKTFSFGSAYTPNNDVVLVGFVQYQVTTPPTLYGVNQANAIITNTPVINGTSNTGTTTPLANGATMTAFTADTEVPYAWLT